MPHFLLERFDINHAKSMFKMWSCGEFFIEIPVVVVFGFVCEVEGLP